MPSTNPLFDTTSADTPAGLAPTIAASTLTGVPLAGTGLAGQVYVTNGWIGSVEALEQVIAENPPLLDFTSTAIDYSGTHSGTTIAEFLGDDAASMTSEQGNWLEMGPSGITLKGFVYIPPGRHEIGVTSDDGFSLKLGGVDFSEYANSRSAEETVRVADFAGGLYELEILYFDAGGRQELSLQLDGLTIQPEAYYQTSADFLNPPSNATQVPVDDYHPSYFLGEEALEISDYINGTSGHDVINGNGGDDTLRGNGGDDVIYGGYGDDSIMGARGDDIIDGGYGSDLIFAGEGNDLIIGRSDAGVPRIGQLAIGAPTRPDSPEGEVDYDRQMLIGYEEHPLIGDDIYFGGAGQDTFLISPQINAKLDIIQEHTRSDGSINWARVAGENQYLQDHWVDGSGIDIIGDYNALEDTVAVIGHTANVYVEYRDTDNDGDEESIVTIISKQHGNGGAHDRDLLGQLIVHGDRLEAEDIITDNGVTYGIIEGYEDIAQALFPDGDTKVNVIDGETVWGYDTRDTVGNLGAVTGTPEDYVDNRFLASVTFEDPTEDLGIVPTREPFEQLGLRQVTGQNINGTEGADMLAPIFTLPGGMPGALAYYSFSDTDGSFEDAKGGNPARAYTHYENQALLRTDGVTTGPDGTTLNALEFNGSDEFGFIAHDNKMNITQGTIALWVRPDDLDRDQTFVSKDESGTDEGGHFRLGMEEDGKLFLRFSPGNGRGGNVSWETVAPQLEEGEWTHLAVSFTNEGITVYKDGIALPDWAWVEDEGNGGPLSDYGRAYLVQNTEAWILGADGYRSELNDTAAEFALDDRDLERAFDGAIAEFGVWGGFTPEDVLTGIEVAELHANGPGTALTNVAGIAPLRAGDDNIDGGGGHDMIDGGAGNDSIEGGAGADKIDGGYGNDSIHGGEGNDILDGGRGSDIINGGAGDDILMARSDGGEQRAGQLVLDMPTRPIDPGTIDPTYLKLVDWIDQPLVADDVLIGGEGNDTFYIQPLINATKDIILEHTNEDRSINWAGVAGENTYVHDHWVDQFGIDLIADYNRDEDTIAIIGHTANVRDIQYKVVDTDNDGVDDDVVSVITVISNQHGGGGAHAMDLMGYVVVHGDMVFEEDIVTNDNVTYGIVDTVDDIQEALAPTGDTKISVTDDGLTLFGYDTRDVIGDPMADDPESFSSNPFLNAGLVDFEPVRSQLAAPEILASRPGGTFNGVDSVTMMVHSSQLERSEATYALRFTADTPGDGKQTLFSKDHSGYKDGGHLSIYIDGNDYLYVRFQSTTESRYLRSDEKIEAGREYDLAFTFTDEKLELYIDGILNDDDSGLPGGMTGNVENAALGASTMQRWESDDRLRDFFDGKLQDFTVFDRAINATEAYLLAASDSDSAVLSVSPSDIQISAYATIGDDNLMGGFEAVTLRGLSGNDTLTGSAADDNLSGGTDDDTLNGGDGDDMMLGQGDDDLLNGGAGDDDMRGGSGHDTMLGGAGDDTMMGQGNNDSMHGGDGDDDLSGAAGLDVLSGGAGNDVVRGGNGADRIDGGAGDDLLNGGAHGDVFVFGLGHGNDTITGFQDNVDTLELSSALVGGRNAQQVVDDFGSMLGASSILDFGNGDMIKLTNFSVANLADDITIL